MVKEWSIAEAQDGVTGNRENGFHSFAMMRGNTSIVYPVKSRFQSGEVGEKKLPPIPYFGPYVLCPVTRQKEVIDLFAFIVQRGNRVLSKSIPIIANLFLHEMR